MTTVLVYKIVNQWNITYTSISSDYLSVITGAENVPEIIVYKLQADGIMTNNSYVQYKGSLPRMSQFCLCFHAFQIRGRDPTVVIDYATEQANSEIIISEDFSRVCFRTSVTLNQL